MLYEGGSLESENGGRFSKIKDVIGTLGERALHFVAILAGAGVTLERLSGIDYEDAANCPFDVLDEIGSRNE